MSQDNRQDLKEIKEKIDLLESRLLELVGNINENINIAKLLQKKLIPNQLKDVPGMKAIGRFIPGEEISAEGYDLFTDKDSKYLWFAYYWTETFGLSSVLLQSLIHLQIRAQEKGSHLDSSLSDVFDNFVREIADYKTGLKYRVLLAKVNLHTLKAEFMSTGMPPFISRNFLERDSQWEVIQKDIFQDMGKVLEFAETGSKPEIIHYEEQLKPGFRLFFISPNWNLQAKDTDSFFKPLELDVSLRNLELIDDLNHMLVKIDQKQSQKKSDVSALALEIDPRKIHIA